MVETLINKYHTTIGSPHSMNCYEEISQFQFIIEIYNLWQLKQVYTKTAPLILKEFF